MRDQGIEVTAIALGAGSDRELLARLAASTGGRALFPDDARQLPAILAREAARVAGGGLVDETFTPRTTPHPILSGIDGTQVPPLGGYVVSAAKPSAESVLRSHLDDPVLATWQAGLGKVAVYTADLRSGWSSALRAWSGFDPLVTQTVRWIARRAHDEDVYIRIDEDGDGARLVVEATGAGGEHRTRLDVRASVRAPSGDLLEADLHESSPGRYEARMTLSAAGPYTLAVDLRSGDRAYAASTVRGFYWSASREHESSGVNQETLSAVAAATGGTVLGPGDNPFTQSRLPLYRDARPWLLVLALALFLADVIGPAVVGLVRGIRGRSHRRVHRSEAA
jgi:hypothetical protein